MAERVVVRVPATVANLGPGFDCIGLALGWHDQVRVERAEALRVTVAGTGAERIPRDGSNLVARGVAAMLGDEPVSINQLNAVPYGRGFGSSAAAIVAGLVAGRALAGASVSDEELAGIAATIEGHADNVTPCMLGGVTVIAGGSIVQLAAIDGVQALTCVAPGGMATSTARSALPDEVPRAVAVAAIGRAALLAAALATGRGDLLVEATDDVFHQPARFALMPDSGDLVGALREQGIAAFLSGAGPSVTALVPAGAAEAAAALARRLVPDGWEVGLMPIDGDGAAVVERLD